MLRLLAVFPILISMVASGHASAEGTLFSISSQNDQLRVVDPSDGSTLSSVTLTLPDSTPIVGGTGLATDPSTGDLYAILNLQGQSGRELTTIDPDTGVATRIGDTGRKLAGIAFDVAGSLYGVTGFADADPTTLFSLSLADGAATRLCGFKRGDDGRSLALSPVDGLLYHAAGFADAILEKFEPTSWMCDLIDIPINQPNIGEANGLTWWAAEGVFLWSQGSGGQQLWTLTTDGQATNLGVPLPPGGCPPGSILNPNTNICVMDETAKGIAFVGSTLYAVSNFVPTLRELDPNTGFTVGAAQTIALAGELVEGGTGLARHPSTGDLYALLNLQGQFGRELVTLDPTTAVATSIGDTGAKFAALAFDASGTLYSVTGESTSVTGGPASENSETLFTLDLGTGQPELVCALGNGDSGESLAFNPEDGLIYHGSGFFTPFFASEQVFEKFDPASFACARTDILLSDRTIGEVGALTFRQSAGAFLWAQGFEAGTGARNLFSIAPSGEVTLIGPMDHKSKGLAFRPPPVPALAPWALGLLAGAVGAAGIARLHRRHALYPQSSGP